MISILCPPLVFQGVGFGGLPLPFGKLFSYEAGTSAPQATWTDSTQLQQNSNPVILNANGQAQVWLDPSLTYKFRLTDALNNQIYVTDQVQGSLTAAALSVILTQEFIGAILYPISAAEISASITPVNFFYPYGNILRYGSNSAPGITDMSQAARNCLLCNAFMYVPSGTYSFITVVNCFDGQQIYGDSRTSTIITSPTTRQTFLWEPPGANARQGPIFHDLTINSDFPITINSPSNFLVDGSGDSPCQGASFYDLVLNPTIAGTGNGITAAKMFDSRIYQCLIQSFANGVLMVGCDLNEIDNNRITFFSTYGILDMSAQLFGSQNDIHHNDILAGSGSTSTYIKTSSRHVSIHDNYMEQIAGGVTCFVDATTTGLPTFGSNVSALPLSVVIRDNRVDGESFASSGVYRIDPTNAVSIVCDNRNTTGSFGSSAFSTPVTAIFNSSVQRSIRIRGTSWGVWDGYESKDLYTACNKGFSCDGRNLGAIIVKDSNALMQVLGKLLVIPAAAGSGNFWIIPNGANNGNDLFNNSVNYTMTVIARSTATSGDSLGIQIGSNSFGSGVTTVALTNQFRRYSVAITGQLNTVINMGCLLTRQSGANGDIQILSVGWEDTEGLLPNMPSASPGAGTKQLWQDPADSNRVKYAT